MFLIFTGGTLRTPCRQQRLQDLEILGKAANAVVEAQAKRGVLGELIAGANAQQQATTRQLLQGAGQNGFRRNPRGE